MDILIDDEPVHIVANVTHDTTQLGHSSLSRPNYSYRELSKCVSKNKSCKVLDLLNNY